MMKDFKAGEKVTVYNIGCEGQYVGRRALNASVIKWNLPGTEYPEDNIISGGEGGNEGEGDSDTDEPILPPEIVLPSVKEWLNTNKFTDYTNIFTLWEFSRNKEGGDGK